VPSLHPAVDPAPHQTWPLICALFLLWPTVGCKPDDDDDVSADDDVSGDDDDDLTDDDDATDDDTAPWDDGHAVRLAHPQGNAVGLFDLAVCPGVDQVFFTSLHYPAIGVASATDGAVEGFIDLGEYTGDTVPLFAYLACVPGTGTLVVNDRARGQLIRIGAAGHQVIGATGVCTAPGWMEVSAANDTVYVACEGDDTIVQLDGDDLSPLASYSMGDVRVTRFELAPPRLLIVDEPAGKLHVFDMTVGEFVGEVAIAGQPTQSAVWDGDRLFVTDREGGRVVVLDGVAQPVWFDEIPAGSDPYGVTAVLPWGRVFVVARQGAELPATGTYMGDPGVVYALDPDGAQVLSEADVGKTPHFAVFHGDTNRLFVGNEDSLDISAIGPEGNTEWTSPPLGLTLDDAAVDPIGGRIWFPSHLTDQVWIYDWSAAEATAVDLADWPFAAEADVPGRRIYVVTQQRAALVALDADTFEELERWDLGVETHQLPCDPLCTGHYSAVDLKVDFQRDLAYVAHPPAASVLRVDLVSGAVTELSTGEVVDPGPEDFFQHMALAVEPASGRLYAYYNLADRVVAFEGDTAVAEATVDAESNRPLTLDVVRERVLIGDQVLGFGLEPLGQVSDGQQLLVHLAERDLYLAQGTDALLAIDPETLETVGQRPLASLAHPPFWAGENHLAPLMLFPAEEGRLVLVINAFEASIEVTDPASWAPISAR
jgi:DNA-binding beta-propeller fold protein YncE